jgi:hypothetical protein
VSTRAAAALLAGLLAAGLPAAGQTYTFRIGKKSEDRSRAAVVAGALAGALAEQMKEVQNTFEANRRTLHKVGRPGGEPAYPREAVAGLIAHTGEDLDRAIANVRPAGLEPLSAWADAKLQHIQEALAAPPDKTAASFPGFSTPRAVAVVASLGGFPLPEIASVNAAVQPQDTIAAGKADSLLDQVSEVLDRLFSLAAHDDLEVTLWIGSTPAPRAKFSFWPQGRLKGSAPAPTIVRTNGKHEHVLRGLYTYKVIRAQGPVTELIEYPNSTGAAAAGLASEQLDLVNGSSFFCCRFDEQYCQHVADEKECRP